MHEEIAAVPDARLLTERELLRPLPSLRFDIGRSPVTRKFDRFVLRAARCVTFVGLPQVGLTLGGTSSRRIVELLVGEAPHRKGGRLFNFRSDIFSVNPAARFLRTKGCRDTVDEREHPPPSETHQQILQLIQTALIPYEGSATVELYWYDGYEGWFVSVKPANKDAASIEIGLDRWEVLWVSVANSFMETDLWNCPFEKLSEIATSVFAGRVQQIIGRSDGYVRIGDGDERIAFGNAHLPIPWKLRRVRRFAPYIGSMDG